MSGARKAACASWISEWTAEVHENTVPAFVPAELERLYRNTFSSFLAEHVQEEDTHTYVAKAGEVVQDILLFKMGLRQVHVLNAAIHIGAAHLHCFASFIFKHYPSIQVIDFVSVTTDAPAGEFPCQRFRASEDFVLYLPATVQAYDATLGKSTSTGLRTKQKRLKRDFQAVSFQVYERGDIDDRLMGAIFDLKKQGRHGRGRLDEEQQAWLCKVVRTHGFVGVTTVDGRIGAATVSTRIGSHLFLHVLAHDRGFDSYSLGMLNAYLTVCAVIRQGGKEFHFLWGAGIWKQRLKADEQQLDNVFVYRSRAACLACLDLALSNLLRGFWRRFRLGVLDAGAPAGRYAWLIRPCLNGWYRFRGARA